MSLKANLNQIIKNRRGQIFTLQELEAYCHSAHYKLSNAERRLRASESPNIIPVYKGTAIIGYQWGAVGRNEIIITAKPPKGFCCMSMKIFEIHDRKCETLKTNVLF